MTNPFDTGKDEKIEDKVLSITNEGLIKKLEDERATLEELQKTLKNNMTNQKSSQDNIKNTFLQAESIFTDPVKKRKESNFEMRQLLTLVRFG